MKDIFKYYKSFKGVFIPAILFLIIGVATGFIGATAFALIIFSLKKYKYKLEFFLIAFLLTYILANNFSGPFAYNGNLRFIILALALVVLIQINISKVSLAWYSLPFVIVSFVITLLFSPLGFEALSKSLGYIFVAFTIFKLTDILYVKQDKIAIILFHFFLSFLIINLVLVINPNFYLVGRFMGLTGNPNGLGMLLVFMYGVIDLLKQRKELTSIKKPILLGYMFLTFALILLTGSRTALGSLIFYVLANKVLTNTKMIIPYSLFMVLALLTIYFVSLQDLLTFVGSNIDLRLNSIETASGRTVVWGVAWEEITRHFWYGQGFMYDTYFIKDYADKYIGLVRERYWGGIWSSYLSLLLNVGIVGLLAFAWMVIKLYKKAKLKATALIYIITVLLIGVTESWMAASMNPFTPLFFLYFAIQNQPLKQTMPNP
ncbi:O-antigen ligase family protein [Tamlana haliotis]|uniref:O-antigen ligase family protein n=1 Tax=Pseudotamlana haliotis TaxID=2614804 RepID=A0A6N6MGD8_9FLAO|nr:O-antigen ligase family protein [Tamlana haliotis]KAB1067855.1 O-antigen ligase family protein [Tamlana haliotis]